MKAIRMALRFGVATLIIGALAACEGPLEAPVPVTESVSAPVAAALATESFTICSSPETTELSYDQVTWIPAFPGGPAFAPYGAQIPGSQWVGPYPASTMFSSAPNSYTFRTTFTLPADVRQATLSGAVHADNAATFYLNGEQFFEQSPVVAYANFQDPADEFFTRRDLVEGLNVVRVELINGGTEPTTTGLDFCLTVSYVPDDGTGGGGNGGNGGNGRCPAAPAVAAAYLRTLGMDPNAGVGRNIVALVADHMTPGNDFDGYQRCDAGYAAAVQAFVEAQM